jgi:serralysin
MSISAYSKEISMTISRLHFAAALISCIVCEISATTYYVSPTGLSTNNGSTPALAWDVTKACNTAGPGDTVLFMDGVYTGGWNQGQIKIIGKVGSNTNRLVWKSINKWGAVLVPGPSPYPGILFYQCVGVTVDGFSMDFSNTPGGFGFGDCNYTTIRNCKIGNSGGSGIGAGYDNILIENNIVFNCAKRSTGNESGISIYEPVAQDNDTANYGIILRGNICFDNAAGPYADGSDPTDGNGIIIDDWRHSQNPGVSYAKKGLVENNLCFNNGGHGIHIFFSDRITVRNNTAWHNNTVLRNYQTRPGEITFTPSSGSACYNNIMVATDNGDGALSLETGDVIPVQNNIIIGAVNTNGSATTMSTTLSKNNKVVAVTQQNYVKFVNAATDTATCNFRLQTGSPAIDSGNNLNASSIDLDGRSRPVNSTVDIGAYEYSSDTRIIHSAIMSIDKIIPAARSLGFSPNNRLSGIAITTDKKRIMDILGRENTRKVKSWQ